MPFRQLANVGIQMIPGVATRAVQDDGRLEGRGVVEASDEDPDEFRALVRLVVDRGTAIRAKSLSLGRATVGGSRVFLDLAGDGERARRKHEHRAVTTAGVPLAIAAPALKSANGLSGNGVANRAARAAAGKAHALVSSKVACVAPPVPLPPGFRRPCK